MENLMYLRKNQFFEFFFIDLPQKVAFYLFFCANYTYFFKKFSARSAESKFKNFERNEWNFTVKKHKFCFKVN